MTFEQERTTEAIQKLSRLLIEVTEFDHIPLDGTKHDLRMKHQLSTRLDVAYRELAGEMERVARAYQQKCAILDTRLQNHPENAA